MNGHPTLFEAPSAGAVRRSDPVTSVAAARRLGTSARAAVLDAFRAHGPMTDEQLADRLVPDGFHGPTVKRARTALRDAGLIVETGRTSPSRRQCEQIVWALHHKLRPTETVADQEGRVA